MLSQWMSLRRLITFSRLKEKTERYTVGNLPMWQEITDDSRLLDFQVIPQ